MAKNKVGDIYNLHPKHLVDKKGQARYQKSHPDMNDRPVMVAKQSNKGDLKVSKITTTPTPSQIEKKQVVPLKRTKGLKPNSHVETDTTSKSASTGKSFNASQNPFNKTPKTRVHDDDYKDYKKAVNQRHRDSKKKNKDKKKSTK